MTFLGLLISLHARCRLFSQPCLVFLARGEAVEAGPYVGALLPILLHVLQQRCRTYLSSSFGFCARPVGGLLSVRSPFTSRSNSPQTWQRACLRTSLPIVTPWRAVADPLRYRQAGSFWKGQPSRTACRQLGLGTFAPRTGSFQEAEQELVMTFGRGALLWLLGIPLPIILLLAIFWR